MPSFPNVWMLFFEALMKYQIVAIFVAPIVGGLALLYKRYFWTKRTAAVVERRLRMLDEYKIDKKYAKLLDAGLDSFLKSLKKYDIAHGGIAKIRHDLTLSLCPARLIYGGNRDKHIFFVGMLALGVLSFFFIEMVAQWVKTFAMSGFESYLSLLVICVAFLVWCVFCLGSLFMKDMVGLGILTLRADLKGLRLQNYNGDSVLVGHEEDVKFSRIRFRYSNPITDSVMGRCVGIRMASAEGDKISVIVYSCPEFIWNRWGVIDLDDAALSLNQFRELLQTAFVRDQAGGKEPSSELGQ